MLLPASVSLRNLCSTSCGCSLGVARSICSAARRRRVEVFNAERKRQLQRCNNDIEKVIITVLKEDGEERHLLMNNRLSTFYDCAKHISRLKAQNTAVAHVITESSEHFASPHAAIDGKARVELLEFNNAKFADNVNKAYWRSCSFLLGAVAESSFRANVCIIGSLPPVVESGRFVHVAAIEGLHDWRPSKAELDALTGKTLREFVVMALPFEPLTVERQFAIDLFAENEKKVERIMKGDDENVTLYKVGGHVDVAEGPLIANTRQIGRFAITAVHYVDSLYYFSGVSLPSAARCSSYSWDLLTEAARSPPEPRSQMVASL
uniref:39S ribosomal protein L39, mitochondrial n=1 Tax=Parascaris univalens TaxID=6257 RepID=A0A915BBD6_PARUN